MAKREKLHDPIPVRLTEDSIYELDKIRERSPFPTRGYLIRKAVDEFVQRSKADPRH